jgi:hypothetical protein
MSKNCLEVCPAEFTAAPVSEGKATQRLFLSFHVQFERLADLKQNGAVSSHQSPSPADPGANLSIQTIVGTSSMRIMICNTCSHLAL